MLLLSDKSVNFLFLKVVFALYLQFTAGLLDHLDYYETLHVDDLHHSRIKRDVDGRTEREMHFSTLGRTFHLHLRETTNVFTKDFKVMKVDSLGHETQMPFGEVLYHGYVEGEDESWVQAYLEEQTDLGKRNLMATIKTANEIFTVEPAWRHLPPSSNHSMITYRASDLDIANSLGDHFCGYISPEEVNSTTQTSSPDSGRSKRSTNMVVPKLNTCPLLVVADYRFFKEMGQSNFYKTTSYLISLIDRINNIYRNTLWGNGYTNMGFAVKEIRVHDNYTPRNRNYQYNVDQPWDTKRLLEALSQDKDNQKFCLVHLFTYIQFNDGSLGLSYVASSSQSRQGGICSTGYSNLYLNTGWSTSVNRFNRPLLTQEAELVTTHELGHNWGSEHDPKTDECSPSSFKGGKYIMYTYAVSGHDRNNRNFSVCSRRTVGKVLQSKSKICFTEELGSYCGNSNVEEEEQCDPGLEKNDKCCTPTCRLKPGALCSDKNTLCCHNCTYAPRTTICRIADSSACTEQTKCLGTSPVCPAAKNKPNGEQCQGEWGECRDGRCLSVCEKNNLQSCACDEVEDSCKWCCLHLNGNTSCRPILIDGGWILLPEGMPCIQGLCDSDGKCEKIVQDLTTRLWKIIEQLGPNKIVAFMRANIVGTVITLSLFLWIPVSCIVCHIDRKNKRKEKELHEWFHPTNPQLVLQKDFPRVRQASVVQHRRIGTPQFGPS